LKKYQDWAKAYQQGVAFIQFPNAKTRWIILPFTEAYGIGENGERFKLSVNNLITNKENSFNKKKNYITSKLEF
jgi:hypothetical protein